MSDSNGGIFSAGGNRAYLESRTSFLEILLLVGIRAALGDGTSQFAYAGQLAAGVVLDRTIRFDLNDFAALLEQVKSDKRRLIRVVGTVSTIRKCQGFGISGRIEFAKRPLRSRPTGGQNRVAGVNLPSIVEVAREHSGLTDEQLLAKVSEIDLRDGVADGKIRGGAEPCKKCGRTLSKRHMSCMYCGEPIIKEHTFQP